MATVFLRGGNQSAYVELLKDYRKDYVNREDNYPKLLRQVLDVMRQLKPTKKPNDNAPKNRNGQSGGM